MTRHRLFANAVESIQAGIEDYAANDPKRTASAVRNFYAGVLLLAKDVLLGKVPNATPEAILADRYKPIPNGEGDVEYIAGSHRTVDFHGISERFKDFGLSIDKVALSDLTRIRNDIEHLFSSEPRTKVLEAIAKAMPVVASLFRQAGEDPAKALGDTWQTMLQVKTLYECELKICQATFGNVNWYSPTLARLPMKCVECNSELVAQKDASNADRQSIDCECRSCGAKADAEATIVHSLGEYFDYESYTAAKDGDAPPIGTCPECGLETYLTTVEEQGCVWCECVLEKCARCHVGLTPENVAWDSFNLCGYCADLAHKD
jgi:plasmid stabilization system protein ParE